MKRRKETQVDAAYRRGRVLTSILEDYRKQVAARPHDRRWIELGFVEDGTKSSEAKVRIEETFDELAALLTHVAILEMAASFENAARARLGTAIGKVRSAHKASTKKEALPIYSSKLIAEVDDYKGLGGIAILLDGYLDATLKAKLEATRDARNLYAHGTNVEIPATLDAEDVRILFNELLEQLSVNE